ncbi:sensor histidine kinase [Paenibacillus nasutitermitis]|uniref:histidine kinase n=1 Tax=Paenibacillus nasutitermitis TaxID=1652958 RepID=A0A917E0H2_9BACL|nr:ATP-binding protein [Paenibacillus nasutitermitis]GGD91198.1 hypothetical protein GCM10010911_57350 [Paenibacillus nasutitermitis]
MLLHRHTSLYVSIGCRWILLIIGILLYSGENGNGSAGLVLAAVSLQALYSFVFLNKSLERAARITMGIDMLFQIYLLWSAGGIAGPFIFYSLSSLIMLKKVTRWKTYYVSTFMFLLFIPLLFSLLERIALNAYLAAHWTYMVYVILFYGAAAAAHYSTVSMTAHIRILVMIYSSSRMQMEISHQGAIRYIEELLKKILKQREVWLCVGAPGPHEQDQSWMHTYFRNELKQNPPAAPKAYIHLLSPIGEKTPLYVRTLRDRNGNEYGWLLIRADINELSILQHAYIQLVLIKFQAHYDINKQVKEKQDSAVAIERDYIAQNIHDGIAQELFFLSIQLFQLKSLIPADARDEAMPLLSEMEKKVKESHRDIRKFIVELKGEKRRFNLQDAIERMLQRITTGTGVELVFDNIGWIPQERIEIEETIYHFIEEAANNVIKHAKATKLQVKLEVTSVQWTILIRDDGKGIEDHHEDAHQGKFGMKGMTSRIKALNGSISIHSGESIGTTIMADIPRERSLAHV